MSLRLTPCCTAPRRQAWPDSMQPCWSLSCRSAPPQASSLPAGRRSSGRAARPPSAPLDAHTFAARMHVTLCASRPSSRRRARLMSQAQHKVDCAQHAPVHHSRRGPKVLFGVRAEAVGSRVRQAAGAFGRFGPGPLRARELSCPSEDSFSLGFFPPLASIESCREGTDMFRGMSCNNSSRSSLLT